MDNNKDNEFGLSKKNSIESIANCFLDINCNEDNVYFINHSNTTHFEFYHSFELLFSTIANNVLGDKLDYGELTKDNVLDYLRNESGSNGFDFIRKTKKCFMKDIVLSLNKRDKEHILQITLTNKGINNSSIEHLMT